MLEKSQDPDSGGLTPKQRIIFRSSVEDVNATEQLRIQVETKLKSPEIQEEFRIAGIENFSVHMSEVGTSQGYSIQVHVGIPDGAFILTACDGVYKSGVISSAIDALGKILGKYFTMVERTAFCDSWRIVLL